jgi:hypothetical protein
MGAQIDRMQVQSFWLEVPRRALERLPGELAPELSVRLLTHAAPEGELLELTPEAGASRLRFASVGEGVVALQEIHVQEDPDGAFFLHTLGALMVRFGGDLEAQVRVDGKAGPLRIVRGVTDYPGLSTHAAAAHLSQAAQDAGSGSQVEAGGGGEQSADPGSSAQLSAREEQELKELLESAQAHWAEYQRLKGRGQG